ncbi:MAG: CarD family transcriptional regulator [Treponema sp.]|nr:CarD family transcriptional regulator [Candidatus Treponema equifaecale]
MSTENPQFAVDQRVVYPSQGVGLITEIYERDIKGEKVPYYKIYIEVSDMTVMVPVKNAEMLGIRQIVSADDALKALESLSDEIEPVTSDWKQRYQMNLDLLKQGSIYDIASIVRCLYHRSKVKELPILERKLYDSAKKLLEDEIAFATGKSIKEVEGMLHAKLEPLGAILPKKATIIDDDEDDDDEFGDEVASSRNDDDDDDDSDESEEADNTDDDDEEDDE